MNVEEMLENTDFTRFSKIRSSLLQQLLSQRAMRLDEMDMVVAAGNGILHGDKDKHK